jgi:serine/threonine-protein kinase
MTVRSSDVSIAFPFRQLAPCVRARDHAVRLSHRNPRPEETVPSLLRAQDALGANGQPRLGRSLADRYTLLASLGAGGTGTVYRARDMLADGAAREVAVKILHRNGAFDAATKARFVREAWANGVLASPHTVRVLGCGETASGELFLVMELLEGETLGARLERVGRLDVSHAIDLAQQALRALAEAHEKGLVHRDLKPDNLFLTPRANGDLLKVLDFGVATMSDDLPTDGTATVFGTPRYMSPEQALGRPADARSDLYSLGVILYQCLAGRPPFAGDDAIEVMAHHVAAAPPPLSEVAEGIPPAIGAIIMRTLAKAPSARPVSAVALSEELTQALHAERAATHAGRPLVWVFGIAAAAVLGGMSVFGLLHRTFAPTRGSISRGARAPAAGAAIPEADSTRQHAPEVVPSTERGP